jgi:hypothetical protein
MSGDKTTSVFDGFVMGIMLCCVIFSLWMSFFNKPNTDIRDEFAKAALTGLLAGSKTWQIDGKKEDVHDGYQYVKCSYNFADLMLKARKPEGGTSGR